MIVCCGCGNQFGRHVIGIDGYIGYVMVVSCMGRVHRVVGRVGVIDRVGRGSHDRRLGVRVLKGMRMYKRM